MGRETFDAGLEALARSASYRAHNARVHGSPGLRFGMVDGAELEVVLEAAALAPGARFVDLGCAWGTLTAEIARRTGARGLGIDIAASAIARTPATGEYQVGDLDALDLPSSTFQAAIAADTLYFCADRVATLRAVARALTPDGRLVVAWTDRTDRDLPDTRLGLALRDAGYEVTLAHDASETGRAFWQRSVDSCLALERDWRVEDPVRFEALLDEARASLAALASGSARRWIVAAEVGGGDRSQ